MVSLRRHSALLLLLLSAPIAHAQPDTATVNPVRPVRQPAVIQPQARQLLLALSERYNAVKSYSSKMVLEVKDEKMMGEKQAAKMGFQAQIAWQRPDRIRIEGSNLDGPFLAVSDGVMLSAKTATRPATFAQRNANPWVMSEAFQELNLNSAGQLFFTEKGYLVDRLFKAQDLLSISADPDVEVEGTVCHSVTAKQNDRGMSQNATFLIGAEDGLLHRLVSDVGQGENRVKIIETYSDIRLNPDLDAATWSFVPTPEDKKVDTFLPYDPHKKEPKVKVGEELPTFTSPTLDGKTLSLTDLRGQPVLLYFYYPSPRFDNENAQVADLARKYADQGLKVVAVSMLPLKEKFPTQIDGQPTPFPVLFDFKEFKNDFGFNDTQNTVATLYGMNFIGAMLLVDREGKLVRIARDFSDLKFSGDLEKTLAKP